MLLTLIKKWKKILIEELEKYKKNYSFLSEENGKIENKDKENVWIIDPIDGTNNFLHGIHFSISIGLKSKNEIIAGVIFDPIKNELFFAEKDNGSYINNHRIRVSKKNNLMSVYLHQIMQELNLKTYPQEILVAQHWI